MKHVKTILIALGILVIYAAVCLLVSYATGCDRVFQYANGFVTGLAIGNLAAWTQNKTP